MWGGRRAGGGCIGGSSICLGVVQQSVAARCLPAAALCAVGRVGVGAAGSVGLNADKIKTGCGADGRGVRSFTCVVR